MARPFARGLLAVAAVWLTGCVSAQQQPATPVARVETPPPVAAPVRAAPTRPTPPPRPPQLWAFVRLRNTDYVNVRDIATRYNLKPTWTKPDTILTLSDSRGVRFTFEANQRDCYFDGMRVLLGENVLVDRDSLWVTKLDVIKLIAPLFSPADHLAFLPATAPKTVVLDPGHGGSDPGKENKLLNVNEKTFTLDVALRVKKLLEPRGWRVLMTRSDDRELSPVKKKDLQLRDDLANNNKADLFLSIHFNSVEKDPERVTGVETYTMTPQFMFSATDSAKGEMTDTAFPGNRLDYANLLFGESIHRAMHAGIKTPDRGFKRGRLAVLRFLDCPGALVECGYLSSIVEARRIATPEFRQQIAESIVNGIQGYAETLAALRSPPPAATK